MKIVKPTIIPMRAIITDGVYKFLEYCARTCYKSVSNDKLSSEDFIRKLIKSGHESVLEHYSVSFRIICDRGISHELVRHRLASYSQESTRYCNYAKEDIEFIKPSEIKEGTPTFALWEQSCKQAEATYNKLIACRIKAETARSVLPHSLKTEIVMTANLREWRHFLKLRYAGETGKPHPDMLQVSSYIFDFFKTYLPIIVEDIAEEKTEEKTEATNEPNSDWYISYGAWCRKEGI